MIFGIWIILGIVVLSGIIAALIIISAHKDGVMKVNLKQRLKEGGWGNK